MSAPYSIDDDAALVALARRAIGFAVDSALGGAAFIPFLWWIDHFGWRLHRFVSMTAMTSSEAEDAARGYCRLFPPSVPACVFAYDGYSRMGDVRYDTVFCHVSRRAPARGLVVAQTYVPGARGGTETGELRIKGTDESWLA